MFQLGLEEGWPKTGGQAIGQGNTVPAQHHQVHGRQELFQTETAVHRDVRELPDFTQFSNRET